MTVDLDRIEKWARRAEETGEFPAVTFQEVLALVAELRAARRNAEILDEAFALLTAIRDEVRGVGWQERIGRFLDIQARLLDQAVKGTGE